MESYLRRGYIEFLTLSPVFIGSGKELNKKEYIYDRNTGSICLVDFRKMRKMGHFSSLVKLIPGMSSLMSAIKPDDEQTAKDLIKTESIINSMTDEERHNPDLIDSSRRARIAAGSGRTISDVKLLQNQFNQSLRAKYSDANG